VAIRSWSHSKLVEADKCMRRVWLMHDQRIPEPQRPLPPGKTEHANDRGTRIHTGCELYVKGEADILVPEAEKHFGPEIDFLRVLYGEGVVSLEGEWGVDQEWEPCDWKTAWHRCKLDALVFPDPTEAIAIDYKTGKRWGNEVKHGEQMTLYALNTVLRYPEVERVRTELWYLDQNEIATKTFTRDQALRFKQGFHKRGLNLTTATEFPPRPNIFSCKWCMYGPWGTGHCPDGVQDSRPTKAPPRRLY
jgi:hypothetical protein